MNAFLHRWRTTLLLLPAALVLGGVAWVCVGIIHGLGVVMSDGTQFEFDHNLPRNYEGKTTGRLEMMQAATMTYAQNHKGYLPPMRNANMTLDAIRPYLESKSEWCAFNPATAVRFTPNAALASHKIGAFGKDAIAFYDTNPPTGYRESYYVTVTGKVGHVPVTNLPKLLLPPTGR